MKKILVSTLLVITFFATGVYADTPAVVNAPAQQEALPATDAQLDQLPPPESDNPGIADKSPKDTFKEFVNRGDFFQFDLYGLNNWWNWSFAQANPPAPYTPTGNNYGYLIGARLDVSKYFGVSYEYQSVQVNNAVPFIGAGGAGLTMVNNYNTVNDLNFLVRVTPYELPVQAKWLIGYRWNTLWSYGNYGNQNAGAYVSLNGLQTGVIVESGQPLLGRIRPYARAEFSTVSWNFRPGLTVEAIPHVEVGAAYDYTGSWGSVNGTDYTNRQWLYGVTFRF